MYAISCVRDSPTLQEWILVQYLQPSSSLRFVYQGVKTSQRQRAEHMQRKWQWHEVTSLQTVNHYAEEAEDIDNKV